MAAGINEHRTRHPLGGHRRLLFQTQSRASGGLRRPYISAVGFFYSENGALTQMAVIRPNGHKTCHSRVPVASGSYLLASLAGSTRLSISAYLPIRPSARPPLPARPTPRPPPPGTLQIAEHPLNAARRGGQTI